MKITPTKYTNVDLSVLGLSAEITHLLKDSQVEKYDKLYRKVIRKKGDMAKTNFVYALVFLYSLGKIKYYPDQDTLELTK